MNQEVKVLMVLQGPKSSRYDILVACPDEEDRRVILDRVSDDPELKFCAWLRQDVLVPSEEHAVRAVSLMVDVPMSWGLQEVADYFFALIA